MRISDWSSDVCSSDLLAAECGWGPGRAGNRQGERQNETTHEDPLFAQGASSADRSGIASGVREASWVVRHSRYKKGLSRGVREQIGRESCRDRGCKYVESSVVDGSLKKKNRNT